MGRNLGWGGMKTLRQTLMRKQISTLSQSLFWILYLPNKMWSNFYTIPFHLAHLSQFLGQNVLHIIFLFSMGELIRDTPQVLHQYLTCEMQRNMISSGRGNDHLRNFRTCNQKANALITCHSVLNIQCSYGPGVFAQEQPLSAEKIYASMLLTLEAWEVKFHSFTIK